MITEGYFAVFQSKEQAIWVTNRLRSYGIIAWREGEKTVSYRTTHERQANLRCLFAWWTGIIYEWWFRLDSSWYVTQRGFYPGACVETARFGSNRPNPFAFNDEWKQKYRVSFELVKKGWKLQ